jgi:hypothetical protein
MQSTYINLEHYNRVQSMRQTYIHTYIHTYTHAYHLLHERDAGSLSVLVERLLTVFLLHHKTLHLALQSLPLQTYAHTYITYIQNHLHNHVHPLYLAIEIRSEVLLDGGRQVDVSPI